MPRKDAAAVKRVAEAPASTEDLQALLREYLVQASTGSTIPQLRPVLLAVVREHFAALPEAEREALAALLQDEITRAVPLFLGALPEVRGLIKRWRDEAREINADDGIPAEWDRATLKKGHTTADERAALEAGRCSGHMRGLIKAAGDLEKTLSGEVPHGA